MIRCRRVVIAAPRALFTCPARYYATPVDNKLEKDIIRSPPLRRTARNNDVERPQKGFTRPLRKRCLSTHGRACSILTTTPQTTTLADLLDQIPKLNNDTIRKAFGVMVFLVTPAYASAARNEQDLIERATRRIYPHSTGQKQHVAHGLHTLVAVVDRLPPPDRIVNHGGSEGLAFMFSDDMADVPNISVPRADILTHNIRDIATSFKVKRSLTFDIVTEKAYEGHAARDNKLIDSADRSYSVQVPLANTIFQNGLPSTLIHTRYDKAGTSDWTKTSFQHLNSQNIRIPFFVADDQGSNLRLTAPLVPLTPARSVVASMGNIVRRLSAGPQTPTRTPDDGTILASQELETSVQDYFKARDIPPQKVQVWALVVPKDAFAAHSTSMIDILQPQDLTQRWKENKLTWIQSAAHTPLSLLQHGAKLHKVLSGGGGWGKKAGLLSLDPDSTYTPEDTSSQDTAFFAGLELEAQAEGDSALRSIVSPGDHIQFYISPTASDPAAPVEATTATEQDRNANIQSAEFGAIPSTIDSMPVPMNRPTENKSGIRTIPNHFGALSEVGIALTINKHDVRDRQNVQVLNQSKIDVPFGRFGLRTVPEGDEFASSSAGDSNPRVEKLWDILRKREGPGRDEERIDLDPETK